MYALAQCVNKQNKYLDLLLVCYSQFLHLQLFGRQYGLHCRSTCISRANCYLVILVDQFSKAVHFETLPTHFSTCKAVELFIQMICKLHGYPKSIISDRNPIFINKFWQKLFHLNGMKLRMSNAHHPQIDSQIEVLNCCLQPCLCSFVHGKPSNWVKFLHLAEWNYNTLPHNALASLLSEWYMAIPHQLFPLLLRGPLILSQST